MKVYNCGMISSLATQKPNDGATQYTKAINGNAEEEVDLGCFVSSEHIDHSFIWRIQPLRHSGRSFMNLVNQMFSATASVLRFAVKGTLNPPTQKKRENQFIIE